MAVYYPQAVMTLRVLWEDRSDVSKSKLQKLYTFTVLPKEVTVNINSYREADTFSCAIDFKYFPFDPRAIRACGVTIHIEDRNSLYRRAGSSSQRKEILEPTEDNIVFQGFVDEDSVELDDGGRTVRFEGRDFTSLLIDREYNGPEIQLSKPVDQVIQDLIDQVPEARVRSQSIGLEVVNRTGQPLPVLAQYSSGKTSKSGVKNPRKSRTYWDHIQRITAKAALIAYIELDKLVITKPRQLYNRENAKIFVYGKNLKSLNFKRKLGRQKSNNIRVKSLNFETKTVISADIPKDATKAWAQDIGLIAGKDIVTEKIGADGKPVDPPEVAPFLSFRVRDVTTKAQLVEIGQNVFEEVSRQQIEGEMETKEMCTSINDTEKTIFDLTKMRVGMPVEVLIDNEDLKGLPSFTKTGPKSAKRDEIVKFLISKCYRKELAEAIAESLALYDTPFYTRDITMRLSESDGWTCNIGFINFIELPRNLIE